MPNSWSLALDVHRSAVSSPTERLVLYELAMHFNAKTGQCNPSIERLALCTGLGEKTVRRAIARLKQRGEITVERRSRRESGSYTFHLSRVRSHGPDSDRSQGPHSEPESGQSDQLSAVTVSPESGHSDQRTSVEQAYERTTADRGPAEPGLSRDPGGPRPDAVRPGRQRILEEPRGLAAQIERRMLIRGHATEGELHDLYACRESVDGDLESEGHVQRIIEAAELRSEQNA